MGFFFSSGGNEQEEEAEVEERMVGAPWEFPRQADTSRMDPIHCFGDRFTR